MIAVMAIAEVAAMDVVVVVATVIAVVAIIAVAADVAAAMILAAATLVADSAAESVDLKMHPLAAKKTSMTIGSQAITADAVMMRAVKAARTIVDLAKGVAAIAAATAMTVATGLIGGAEIETLVTAGPEMTAPSVT
jgi:hypothetical protein